MIDQQQDQLHIYIYIYIYIYIRNRSEPSMEPSEISVQEEVYPLSTTLCSLFLKKLDNRFKRLPDIPFSFSLKLKPSCHAFSKTLDM